MKRFSGAGRGVGFLVLMAMVVSLATLSVAAEVDTTAGKRSLLFDFKGLSDNSLSSFDGGLGFRYYVIDDLALRAVIGRYWNEQIQAADEQNEIPHSESNRTIDNWDFSLVVEKRLASKGLIAPYLGIGLEIGRSTETRLYSVPAEPTDGERIKTVEKDRYFGALAVAGFEVAIVQGITLGAEYRLKYGRTKYNAQLYRQNTPVDDVPLRTSKNVRLSAASLFLAVSF